MKNKIGILTYFYQTHNYGGMLQSYALPKFLNDNGIDAEQICYTRKDERPFEAIEESIRKKASISERIEYRILNIYFNKKIKPKFNKRNKNFTDFERKVPCSKRVYDLNNISDVNYIYDGFVVGSDQIWTFRCFNPTFFLEFAYDDKKKISYAASIGKSNFTDLEKEYLNLQLSRFDRITVRENDLVDTLSVITNQNVSCVLDPVFLLSQSDWNEIADKRLVEDKYLFCYFLGDDKNLRKIAKQYAKKNDLQIVTIPFANQTYNRTDFTFGNIKMYNSGPNEFISLIKYADCVFTDSFHATAFSLIFKKEFIAFQRIGLKGMSSRLYSVTELLGCQDHFCDDLDKMTIDYINSIKKINYDDNTEKFEQLKIFSKECLLNSLLEEKDDNN